MVTPPERESDANVAVGSAKPDIDEGNDSDASYDSMKSYFERRNRRKKKRHGVQTYASLMNKYESLSSDSEDECNDKKSSTKRNCTELSHNDSTDTSTMINLPEDADGKGSSNKRTKIRSGVAIDTTSDNAVTQNAPTADVNDGSASNADANIHDLLSNFEKRQAKLIADDINAEGFGKC